MNSNFRPTALIAEDEPLLAAALRADLAKLWPELQVVACVGDGHSAVAQALALLPDVLLFDIRMPGQSGIEAAAALADAWVTSGEQAKPFPALVFVTAYDQYAVAAFEAQAMDYLLKPVQPERLKKTIVKLRAALENRAQAAMHFIANSDLSAPSPPPTDALLETTLAQLRDLLRANLHAANPSPSPTTASTPPLQVIQASSGNTIHMVPIDEVLCFEAADKYVRVLTAQREYVIRTPLKELQTQLAPQSFWQIHRGTIVRAVSIEKVTRDEAGKTYLNLHGLTDRFVVSRLYSHLFKAM
jgi:DNA-binding LytR/AlgR family response regulator